MEVYLVGGAVRDELLGIQVTERDWVVVGATPEEMEAQGYQAVGKDFPVFLHPVTKEEYALARTERKKGHGYRGFEIHAAPDVTLEEDLVRRDLTINAIAQSESGEIFDPYGGLQDLENKILRHVSDAFSEDPLRVLRVARIAAKLHSLGFKIDNETLVLMRQIVTTRELGEISKERIWQETSKALLTDSPGEFFEVLKKTNALAQVYPYFYHPYSDTRDKKIGLASLRNISKQYIDVDVRFAAFIGGLFFHETSDNQENINKFTKDFPLPKKCKKLLKQAVFLQHDCHNSLQSDEMELLNLLRQLDVRRNFERFAIFLDVCKAIYISANQNTEYLQKKWLITAAKEIEKVDVDRWVRKKISVEEFANNVKLEQLTLLNSLIQNQRANYYK